MDERKERRVFEKVGAILRGHFIYTSGWHGDVYVNKNAVLFHSLKTVAFCRAIAEYFEGEKNRCSSRAGNR